MAEKLSERLANCLSHASVRPQERSIVLGTICLLMSSKYAVRVVRLMLDTGTLAPETILPRPAVPPYAPLQVALLGDHNRRNSNSACGPP